MPVLVVTVGDPGIVEKEDADSVFMEMICPSGTNPDDSPLYVLCCNDTCSFTWTGAEHINQVSPLGAGGGGKRWGTSHWENSRWAVSHSALLNTKQVFNGFCTELSHSVI